MREVFREYDLTKGEYERTNDLINKIENERITISVIGQFKRGKSRLVNAILGEDILPVGIVPVTAVVTKIDYGSKACTVRFDNGIVKEIAFSDISQFINEQENNDNKLGVYDVEIFSESDFLKGGITFVDTPGVGSVHQKNTDAAYSYVKESDAVIFMLSVDSPINQIEIEFLKNAKEYASKFYFAVNKIDTIEQADLDAYIGYCRNLISKLMEVDDIHIFPLSAKTGEGVQELKDSIKHDCDTIVKDIIAKSCKLKMKDIGASALSQISLYRKTLQMTHKEFDETFKKLTDSFDEIIEEAKVYGEQFKSNPRMLDAHLNDIKNVLSNRVQELFGIEYHYNISTVDFFRGGKNLEDGTRDLSDDFVNAVQNTLDELNDTMSKIFMYREESAYVVTKKIYEVNALVRRLVRLRTELDRSESWVEPEKKPEFKEVNCY